MKKFLCFLLACVMVLGTVGAVEYYEVDTKYGTKTVIVPNGYTTEDVLCEIAKAYYELSGDFDVLTVQYEELLEEVKDYISKNEELRFSYETLQKQYQTLVSLQNKESLLDNFGFYVSMESSINNDLSMGLKGGILLAKRVMLGGGLRLTPKMENPLQLIVEVGCIF